VDAHACAVTDTVIIDAQSKTRRSAVFVMHMDGIDDGLRANATGWQLT
jgi:hypothetical protein